MWVDGTIAGGVQDTGQDVEGWHVADGLHCPCTILNRRDYSGSELERSDQWPLAA